MRFNIQKALYEIKDTLQDLVADFLDVNRHHIRIDDLGTELIGEDYYDWSENPDDACEGTQVEIYYQFTYSYREDTKNLDYEDPVDMIWLHIESPDYVDGFRDEVMTTEEFDKLFEKKKADKCSMWYEE